MTDRDLVGSVIQWMNDQQDLGYREDELIKFVQEYMQTKATYEPPKRPKTIVQNMTGDVVVEYEEPFQHEVAFWAGPMHGVHERYSCTCGAVFNYSKAITEHINYENRYLGGF